MLLAAAWVVGACGGGRCGAGKLAVADSPCAPCGAELCRAGGEVRVAPYKDVRKVRVARTGLESAAPDRAKERGYDVETKAHDGALEIQYGWMRALLLSKCPGT